MAAAVDIFDPTNSGEHVIRSGDVMSGGLSIRANDASPAIILDSLNGGIPSLNLEQAGVRKATFYAQADRSVLRYQGAVNTELRLFETHAEFNREVRAPSTLSTNHEQALVTRDYVLQRDFHGYVEGTSMCTNTAAWQRPVNLDLMVQDPGTYKFSWSYLWTCSDPNHLFIAYVNALSVQRNGGHFGSIPLNTGAATPDNLPNIANGNAVQSIVNAAKNVAQGFVLLDLVPGNHNFNIDFRSSGGGAIAAIVNPRLCVEWMSE